MESSERTEVLKCLDSIITYCREVKEESPTHFGTIQVAAERCRKKICSHTLQHADGEVFPLTLDEVVKSEEAGMPEGTVITDNRPTSLDLNCYLYHETMYTPLQVCPHCKLNDAQIRKNENKVASS